MGYPLSTPPAPRRHRHARQQGFTLIELMVAVVAGLVVAVAAFAFSKQATRLFSQESRLASTQMAVLTGFQRLQSDVSRSSFMASSNVARDIAFNRICGSAQWPAVLTNLLTDANTPWAGFFVNVGGSAVTGKPPYLLPDGKSPDSARIFGNLASTEAFPVRVVIPGSSTTDVYLQVNNGPVARSGFFDQASFENVFKPGRLLRVLDQEGRQEYGIIQSTNYSAAQPYVTCSALPVKGKIAGGTDGGASSASCGIDGLGIGVQANAVSVVDYALANLSTMSAANPYKNTIYNASSVVPGDDTRTELVRREVSLLSDPVSIDQDPNSEVVAEYAVDLRFGLWLSDPGHDAGLQFIPASSTVISHNIMVKNAGSYSPGVATSGPESVRAVQIRLVTRSREFDRSDAELPGSVSGISDQGMITRYARPNGGGVARARTLTADVTLQNQRGDTWW